VFSPEANAGADCVAEKFVSLLQGYRDLIDGLDLPDPNDRHVLAAAIRAQAETDDIDS